MFRDILRQAIQAVERGDDPKGVCRDSAQAAFVATTAGSIVRD
jgi:hypothetical protein